MSDRRNKSRLGVVLLIFVLIAFVGGWLLFFRFSDEFRTAVPLDVSTYVSSANSLRGNVYKLEGEVMALLAWSPSGRIVSVGVEGGRRAIPVLLSNEFNSVNMQKGQALKFLVVVEDNSVLHARKLAKL